MVIKETVDQCIKSRCLSLVLSLNSDNRFNKTEVKETWEFGFTLDFTYTLYKYLYFRLINSPKVVLSILITEY